MHSQYLFPRMSFLECPFKRGTTALVHILLDILSPEMPRGQRQTPSGATIGWWERATGYWRKYRLLWCQHWWPFAGNNWTERWSTREVPEAKFYNKKVLFWDNLKAQKSEEHCSSTDLTYENLITCFLCSIPSSYNGVVIIEWYLSQCCYNV